MAKNTIQIRRSQSNSTVTGLQAGELAYTGNGNVLFIGDPGGGSPIRVGGQMKPGELTANQALVANSTGGINKIITANLEVSKIFASGDWGTPGYVLTSAGSGANVYWTSSSGFGVDSSATYTWSNNHTFVKAITFNETIIGTAYNAERLGGVAAGSYVNSTFASDTYLQKTNLSSEMATRSANNASYLGTQIATYFAANSMFANYSNTAQLQSATYTAETLALTANNARYLGGTIATGYQLRSDLAANVLTLTSANTLYVGSIPAINVVSNAQLIANLARYATLSGANFNNGLVNAFSYSTGSGYATLNGGTIVNSTIIAIGNSSANGYISLQSNSTAAWAEFSGRALTANSSLYLGDRLATSFADRNEVLYILQQATNNGATETFVTTAVATSLATAKTYSDGKYLDAVGVAQQKATEAFSNVFTTNATFSGVETFNANTLFNANLTASNLYATNIRVDGNLSILGTLTTINTYELQVKDNSILLADTQASTSTPQDSVDFTVYGQFGNTANTWYSGLYRDASESSGHYSKSVWKLFAAKGGTEIGASGLATLTDAESMADAGNYKKGTLSAYLEPYGLGGGFVANSTNVYLMANSSLAITISANTLSLSSALTPVNGGTGQTAFSTGDILYATSSTTFGKKSVGTIGQVLQISDSNLPVYADLDGGNF